MPVHTVVSPFGPSGRQTGHSRPFIFCDRLSEINRVTMPLDQSRCDGKGAPMYWLGLSGLLPSAEALELLEFA